MKIFSVYVAGWSILHGFQEWTCISRAIHSKEAIDRKVEEFKLTYGFTPTYQSVTELVPCPKN